MTLSNMCFEKKEKKKIILSKSSAHFGKIGVSFFWGGGGWGGGVLYKEIKGISIRKFHINFV